MPFDFIVLGLILICLIFYLDLKKHSNLVCFLGIVFLLLGYFIKNFTMLKVSINMFNLFGIIYLILSSIISKEVDKRNSIYGGILIAILYILINYIKFDYNLFFDVKPFILITIIINYINCYSLKESIISTCSAIIYCEIFNAFFMFPKLNFVALFGVEITLCIVVSLLAQTLIELFAKKLKKVKYEEVG